MVVLKQDRYSDVQVELMMSNDGIICEVKNGETLLLTAPAKEAWMWLYDSSKTNKVPKTFLVEFANSIMRGSV